MYNSYYRCSDSYIIYKVSYKLGRLVIKFVITKLVRKIIIYNSYKICEISDKVCDYKIYEINYKVCKISYKVYEIRYKIVN